MGQKAFLNCRFALSSCRTDTGARVPAQRVVFKGSRGRPRNFTALSFGETASQVGQMGVWAGEQLPQAEQPSCSEGQCEEKEHRFLGTKACYLPSPTWDITITQFVFQGWKLRGEEVPSFANRLYNQSKLPNCTEWCTFSLSTEAYCYLKVPCLFFRAINPSLPSKPHAFFSP